MTAIAGIYGFEGCPVERRYLQAMVQAQSHRGSDGSRIWIGTEAGLGRCYQYLDQAPPRPSLEERRHRVLTADARIDNRQELIHLLGVMEISSEVVSDNTLILRAYERWGTACPEYLVGAFAFTIWDGNRKQLFCARDHLGVRPFYYFASSEFFAFASEMKALLALPQVPQAVNERRVADYLMQVHEEKEATFYTHIFRLPPGHSLLVNPDGATKEQYWSLDPDEEVHHETDVAFAEAFERLFTRAVAVRLPKGSSVGSLLSGGLDSSSVTCVAKELLEVDGAVPLDTYSLVFDTVPSSDERSYIEAVVAEGGVNPHYVRGDRLNPFEDIDRMLWHTEEPFFTPNLFLNWGLWKSARQQGTRVLLDGFLGDQVVSHGSRYLTELAARGRLLALAREMHSIAAFQNRQWKTVKRLVKQFVIAPLVVETWQRIRNAMKPPAVPSGLAVQFVNPDFITRVRWVERAHARGQAVPRTPLTARQEHYDELTSGALPGALEIANKAAAAFGLEIRFPFADRRLVEYCLSVPATQKYQNGWTRAYARRAMKAHLPEAIQQRYGKANLHPNFVRGLLESGREQLDEMVFDQLPAAAHYVNVQAIQRAYNQLIREKSNDEVLVYIWQAALLARWLKRQGERVDSCVFR